MPLYQLENDVVLHLALNSILLYNKNTKKKLTENGICLASWHLEDDW